MLITFVNFHSANFELRDFGFRVKVSAGKLVGSTFSEVERYEYHPW
jgi:hypothetical protein